MRHSLLCDELDDITHSYDYGIVPGSATVFVRDELNNIGRLDLTLLEGVMIVVEVSEEGYKVASCSPLSNAGQAITTTQVIQKNLEIPFETMDNLLMAVSPMFRERFQRALYDKLESVHRHQQNNNNLPLDLSQLSLPNNTSTAPISSSTSMHNNTSHLNTATTLNILPSQSILTPQQQQQDSSQQQSFDTLLNQDALLEDLHNWIH